MADKTPVDSTESSMDSFREALTERVRRDMSIVADECRKRIDSLVSIILFGGFARGEGSALLEDGQVMPVGDYDLLAVTREPVASRTVTAVVEEVSRRIGLTVLYSPSTVRPTVFTVQLDTITEQGVGSLMNDLSTYELKHNGKVVFGPNVLDRITVSLADIPFYSPLRILYNRLAYLLETYRPEVRTRTGLSLEEKIPIIQSCVKAYLDVATALCFLFGEYPTTYRAKCRVAQRRLELRELNDMPADLPRRLQMCLEFKCRPDFDRIEDPGHFWFEAKETLLTTIRQYLFHYLGIPISTSHVDAMKAFRRRAHGDIFMKNVRFMLKRKRYPRFLARPLAYAAEYYDRLSYYRLLARGTVRRRRLLIGVRSPYIHDFCARHLLAAAIREDGTADEQKLTACRRHLTAIYPAGAASLQEEPWLRTRDDVVLASKIRLGKTRKASF